MKWMLTVGLMTFSFGAVAADSPSVDTYLQQLKDTAMTCTGMASDISLRQKLAEERYEQDRASYGSASTTPSPYGDTKATVANVEKVKGCISDAQKKGADIYKAFTAAIKDQRTKVDAKDVFIAWVAYINSITISEELVGANEQSALHEAQARLKADALL
jgi:hypothetical protein